MTALTAWVDARLAPLPRRLAVEWPGGRAGADSPHVRLKFGDLRPLAWLASGRIGDIADAYVRGEIDIEGTPSDVMALAAALVGDPIKRGEPSPWARGPQWLTRRMDHWRSRWRHRVEQSTSQVRSHYDISDDFFALWLDPLRVYSCAYFEDSAMDLAQAQQAKLDLVCRKLRLEPGQRFLDVGAGWGGLLLWAAQHYRVRATGITVARNQFAHVNRLIDEAGLRGQVDVRLLDYRELSEPGGYDRIASVGMVEHVGRAHLGGYFARLRALLRPGGLLLNHGITSGGLNNRELGAGMGRFIDRHIFPGGELVHIAHKLQALAGAGLELLDVECLRPHYAQTLWAWSDALEAHLASARELTSEATVRAYRLYLAGCAMSFEQGWLSLHQTLATRPSGEVEPGSLRGAQSDYPFNRSYMYR